MINVINNALSGLAAAGKKVAASASNIANISTTGALDAKNGPKPYEALTTVQKSVTDANGNGQGVQSTIVPKNNGFTPVFDPDSPFANEQGIIGAPNVDLAEEAVNLKIAEIAYKANVSVLKTTEELSDELLRAFDKDV